MVRLVATAPTQNRMIKQTILLIISLFSGSLLGQTTIPIPGLPEAFQENILLYHSFSSVESNKPKADICRVTIDNFQAPATLCEMGVMGHALQVNPKNVVRFSSDDLSLRHNSTISFWFNYAHPLTQNEGAGFLSNSGKSDITGEHCWISFFARGGPWCGLNDTALCSQMYNFTGKVTHNRIVDRKFRENVRENQWHHLVITSNGKTVKGHLNGKLFVTLYAVAPIVKEDNLISFDILGGWNTPVLLDELFFLDISLSDAQIGELYSAGSLLLEWNRLTGK